MFYLFVLYVLNRLIRIRQTNICFCHKIDVQWCCNGTYIEIESIFREIIFITPNNDWIGCVKCVLLYEIKWFRYRHKLIDISVPIAHKIRWHISPEPKRYVSMYLWNHMCKLTVKWCTIDWFDERQNHRRVVVLCDSVSIMYFPWFVPFYSHSFLFTFTTIYPSILSVCLM